jgi:hypothetical protein
LWFIPTIENLLQVPIATPRHPSIQFNLSQEAAIHNREILQKHGNSLNTYLQSQQGTFIAFGSEFRPTWVLEPLLCHHPNWPKLKKILEEGSNWPLSPITKEDRLAKNKELVARGNHRSAEKYTEELRKTLEIEVAQGWMVPLPLDYISSLKNGELAPVGMDDKQWAVLPDGSRKTKFRLTHDQSFNTMHGKSVNDRVLTEKLDPLYYGGCLSRILHYIVSLRLRLPKVKILGGKSDIKAAYRRVTLHGDTAEKCTIMYKEFGLTSLRLTFGGSPCPNEFCTASELCTDLANDLLHCPHWDPSKLFSPHAEKVPPPKYLNESIPYATAKDIDVDIPPDDWGKVDDFIDDGIVVVPDIGNNKTRAIQAMLLAIHILFRPTDPQEKITREDCLSLGKLKEEGFLSETPIILGWKVNTRLLTLQLPTKKYEQWEKDLSKMIKDKKTSFKELEKLVGRLNHAATACPLMRYFLNRLRKMLSAWDTNKKLIRYLSSPVLEDLKLWHRSFLPKIHKGMSLNLITYRRPTVVSWSDACPQGMGGYDSLGNAWQFQLSHDDTVACHSSNNSLEFVAALISVWVAISTRRNNEDCFLALGDNTSAVGWLHKANIDESKNLPLHMAARKYAEILLQADCCLYSQHIAGKHNTIADILSRKFDFTNKDLTTFILSNFAHQVPQSFTVSPLPPEILSWLISWLRKCREKMASQKVRETKSKGLGEDGLSIQDASTLNKTSGSKDLLQIKEQRSSVPLPPPLGDDNSPDLIQQSWLREQCKRPLQNWVRFSGQTWGTTPHMSQGLRDSTQH